MTATWWRVTVTADPDHCDAIAAAIVAATGQSVEEPQAGMVSTVMQSEGDAADLLANLAARFPGVAAALEPAGTVDWSTRWRDGIVTRAFGRLVLTPSWLPVTPRDNQVVVVIDPESAFGSGEHGSTRGALTLLERHLRAGDRVLDLGSGSGILAIAAVKLGARSAIGVEVDDEALPVAEQNARRNQVERAVHFLVGDAADLAALAGPAELVCSNILRGVNTMLIAAILDSLAPHGTIVFAGMETTERSLFQPELDRHGLQVVDEVEDAGWWSAAVRRP